jgi:hypothetical protein
MLGMTVSLTAFYFYVAAITSQLHCESLRQSYFRRKADRLSAIQRA